MVLVDTSIWIRFLSGRLSKASSLDRLLANDEVVGHPLVFGELLIGDRGGRSEFLQDYLRMHQAESVPHADVVTFVRTHRLNGRGVGWIDVHLLASARLERMPLWTADARLRSLSEELKLAF